LIFGLMAVALAGRLLQAWVPRKRELLADASAVQFTRNAEAMEQALVRIAARRRHEPGRRRPSGEHESNNWLV
jgi:Zn-dependent protease with chaperone function